MIIFIASTSLTCGERIVHFLNTVYNYLSSWLVLNPQIPCSVTGPHIFNSRSARFDPQC